MKWSHNCRLTNKSKYFCISIFKVEMTLPGNFKCVCVGGWLVHNGILCEFFFFFFFLKRVNDTFALSEIVFFGVCLMLFSKFNGNFFLFQIFLFSAVTLAAKRCFPNILLPSNLINLIAYQAIFTHKPISVPITYQSVHN